MSEDNVNKIDDTFNPTEVNISKKTDSKAYVY